MIDSSKPTCANFRASQKKIESENGNLKYIDEGEGEVIILLRGVTTSG